MNSGFRWLKLRTIWHYSRYIVPKTQSTYSVSFFFFLVSHTLRLIPQRHLPVQSGQSPFHHSNQPIIGYSVSYCTHTYSHQVVLVPSDPTTCHSEGLNYLWGKKISERIQQLHLFDSTTAGPECKLKSICWYIRKTHQLYILKAGQVPHQRAQPHIRDRTIANVNLHPCVLPSVVLQRSNFK